MQRPEFITVPIGARFLRVRPAAIAYLATDANGFAVIRFIGGESQTSGLTVDELEALAAGETIEKPKAAKAPTKRAA